jgi:hypothetical protein
VAVKITVTGLEATRSMGHLPQEKPAVVVIPPSGVSNWRRVSGPTECPGGQRVTLTARWQCLEPGQWRTLYSDGTVGYPVNAAGPWRLHRGPKEIFEFQYQDPVNPRFLGEIVTFEMEMIVGSW